MTTTEDTTDRGSFKNRYYSRATFDAPISFTAAAATAVTFGHFYDSLLADSNWRSLFCL